MKISADLLLSVVLLGGLANGEAAPAKEDSGFSLLPNAFSKTPLLGMTVFTEMTPYGGTLPVASASAPVYFEAHDHGRRSQGDELGDSVFPMPDALQKTLYGALAVNGYRPAATGQRPSLVLIYHWGSHHGMDPEMLRLFPHQYMLQVLERAALVGGSAYRQKLAREMEFGHTFADRTDNGTFLWEQVVNGVYFVVVSAYDQADVVAGRRRLAWRTTMTVNTNGVSMLDTLPPLVTAAGEYFGRATSEPVAIVRRTRRGTVTIGPLKILPDIAPPEDRN